MPDELNELWEAAIYKEIAAQSFYIALQKRTEDAGARALMSELAQEELKHSELLKNLREMDWKKGKWLKDEIPNLMQSEYLAGSDSLDGVGVQETLIFAMKREQSAIEFYSRMMAVVRGEEAKLLAQRLVHEELGHKLKLELYYESMFQADD